MNSKLYVLFFFVLAFMWACAGHQKPLPERSDPEAQAVIDLIGHGSRHPDSLQALADVDISAYGKKYVTRLALVLKKPQNLRAESIPLIGTPDFFLTLNENQIKAFWPYDGRFYIGKPTAKNFEQFFPLKLPVEGLSALLMGAMPPADKGVHWRMGGKEDQAMRIDGVSGRGKTRSIWLDGQTRIVKMVFFDGSQEPLYTFFYHDFGADNPVIPRKIQIVLEHHQSIVTIRYSDIQSPAEQIETVFDLTVPPGVWPTFLD
jgi:hypothetical protein